MAMAPEPFFLFTPPPAPRHLAELRIDPAHCAVAFSAPCAADSRSGRKRRCLLPASSVRKRMLLELPPFDTAPNTPTPPPTPTTPTAPRPAAEFSFEPRHPASAGNMFAFADNATGTPGGSLASSADNMFAFLERPNTPTGPTSRGGFVFAASSPEGPPLTPTSRGSNTSGLTFLASLKQPLTPMGATASGAAASLHSAKTARTGATGSVGPSPGPACAKLGSPSSAADKETTLTPVGLGTPPFVFSASRSRSLPPPRGGSRKRPRPNLHIETTPRRISPRHSPPPPQQLTPSPQKLAETSSTVNPEASRSSTMSEPCCAFFASPGKAAKQEAKKASSEEASRSPAGSRCTSPDARTSSPEKPRKPEQEVEVSSAVCSGAELVLHVTCKCGFHKEFSFDHRV